MSAQDAQKDPFSARPQLTEAPEAYPLATMRMLLEARTTLADFFSILLYVFVQIDAQKHPKETEKVDF